MLENLLRRGIVPVAALSLILPSCSQIQRQLKYWQLKKELEVIEKFREEAENGTVSSPIPPEKERRLYSQFFNYLENQGIDFFVDSLIDDLRDIGEHSGSINLEGSNVLIEKNELSNRLIKGKKAVADLRRGEEPPEDDLLESLMKLHSVGYEDVMDQVQENPLRRGYLIDFIEFVLDSQGTISRKGDLAYHFHPFPSKLSPSDLGTAWFQSILPLVFAYEDDNLVAFYHEGGQHKTKRFPIESDEKKFQLNLLMAKNYSRSSFVLFSGETETFKLIYVSEDIPAAKTMLYLKKALSQVGKNPEREELLKETIHNIRYHLHHERVYLNSFPRKERELLIPVFHNLRFIEELQSFKKEFNKKLLVNRLQEIDDKYAKPLAKTSQPEDNSPIITQEFEIYVPSIKSIPKPNSQKQRFPWELPIIGISTIAMIGADRYINRKQYQSRKRQR